MLGAESLLIPCSNSQRTRRAERQRRCVYRRMRLATITTLLITAFLGTGCKRSVCDIGSELDPISPAWKAHQDLLPPGATVCGHLKPSPASSFDPALSLHIDFEDDPNPFVAIVNHLESKGLTRTSQNAINADTQDVSFSKDGKPYLTASTTREKRRVRAVLVLVPEAK